MQELVQAIEGLDVDMLQQTVGRAVITHGLELVNKVMIKENLCMTCPI